MNFNVETKSPPEYNIFEAFTIKTEEITHRSNTVLRPKTLR